jgi:hypothetical protein
LAIISSNVTPIINTAVATEDKAMPKSSALLIWTVWAAVFALSICRAPARDLGQWDAVDPAQRQWFNELKQPDFPFLSCCGEADAYWADSYEVEGNQYVAIITDARDDIKLRRAHIEAGYTACSA